MFVRAGRCGEERNRAGSKECCRVDVGRSAARGDERVDEEGERVVWKVLL